MNYAAVRQRMVESQIRTNRVTNSKVIEALRAVPREVFVPKSMRGIAYVDESIDLGGGRYLIEPLVFASMLQAVDIKTSDVVLDIGCVTGYSAAVLARLASTVVAIECDSEMVGRSGALLSEQKIDNVAVVSGNLADGDAAHSPYQVIVIEGAVARIPDVLLRQLSDGGRLVAVVNGESGLGRVTLVTRTGNSFSTRRVFEAFAHCLPGFQRKPGFAF
ncbi:protein-L-isoaspartate O-methyltransferase [Telmatospirillum sp.]|uniref:protein-L-isoaspartate O-methyltransferase family protein n=1 Tax=Telmatospirillum sp. TaxID=2079197 RepID=UPI002843EFED|nr:protein-L-isoaspartate O-methyltransferase [Telmatospirillum sp.]MDR3438227.1 protein-L-isoaspartate O-methyltransferase [Telmatospirillum sp.]